MKLRFVGIFSAPSLRGAVERSETGGVTPSVIFCENATSLNEGGKIKEPDTPKKFAKLNKIKDLTLSSEVHSCL